MPNNLYISQNIFFTDDDKKQNLFLFNENGPLITSQWINLNLAQTTCSFVVMDHQHKLQNACERTLKKTGRFVDCLSFDTNPTIHINPFDLVNDYAEIHFMFLNILYALWDNSDPDIVAMSNLLDAFASGIWTVFANQKEKQNMVSLQKMVRSVRATFKTEDGSTESMSDVFFKNFKDQEIMPCKYYNQFLKFAGDRKKEVEEKLASAFDKLTPYELEMMHSTDPDLMTEFEFKTAFFLNANNEEQEHIAQIMLSLIYTMHRQQAEKKANLVFVINKLNAQYKFANLPQWIKDSQSSDSRFLIICDNLAGFNTDENNRSYFKSLQKEVSASILVHHNPIAQKYAEDLPVTSAELDEFYNTEYECTVLTNQNGEDASEQDLLL